MAARGEGIISLNDGADVRILFNNRALASAEKELKRGILGVADGFVTGESGVTEVAVLLREGMEAARRDARAGGRPVSIQDAYNIMDEAGFATVASTVMESIAEVLGYTADIGEDDPDPN